MVSTVTLADLLSLALPSGTRVLAGADRLAVPVSWACTMRPSPPAFPSLEGGEIAFVAVSDLAYLDGDVTLSRVVADLADVGIAALAALGAIPDDAVSRAQQVGIPLLQLPPDADLMATERAVIRLIVDRQAQVERFGAEVSRQLTQVSVDNMGWDGLAKALVRLSGKGVILQDAAFGLLAQSQPEGAEIALAPLQPDDPHLIPWLRRLSVQGTAALTTEWTATGKMARIVGVMVIEGEMAGTCSLIGSVEAVTASDHVIVERGALAGVMELAKERAQSDTEAKWRTNFWSDLLAGVGASSGALARRAERWGLDLAAPHVVLALGTEVGLGPMQRDRLIRRLEDSLLEREGRGLAVGYRDKVFALLAVRNGEKEQGQVARIVSDLADSVPGIALAGGLSQPAVGSDAIRQAVEEAEMALSLACLSPEKRFVAGAELGLFRLLLPLRGSTSLRAFFADTLSALATYDEANGTELMHTLEIYFAERGNLSRTAEALFLHRNSLLYRMERIASITGFDLDDPDDRLQIQVALKARAFL